MEMDMSFPIKHVTAAALLALGGTSTALAQTVHADLHGFQEVPAVTTFATGTFRAKLDSAGRSIFYELDFGNLQGTVTQAHIHLGQFSVNGGIAVWLCGTGTGNLAGPPGTPVCPAGGGLVNGTITPANVVGPAAQLLGAQEFDKLMEAIRAGVTYANVHSSLVPGGEIRGQIRGEAPQATPFVLGGGN
jgi:CHRD domain